MITKYFMDIIEEQNYDISGVLNILLQDKTLIRFFKDDKIGISCNYFQNTGERSTKLKGFVDKNMNSNLIVGPIEFIEYLITEPSDNVLKDEIYAHVAKGSETQIKLFANEFKKFKKELFNENTINCVENMTLKVLADSNYIPVIGRDKILVEIRKALIQQDTNSVVLTGVAGAGKTAIMEELARIERNNYTVFELNILELLSSNNPKDEFREILDSLASLSGKKILFIDEFHSIVKAGLGDVVKKMTDRASELNFIVATTEEEFKQNIEKDKALERRFSPIKVEEIYGDVLRNVLIAWCDRLSEKTGLTYNNDIVDFVIDKSRIERQKSAPHKQKVILDSAFAGCKLFGKTCASKEDVAESMESRYSVSKEQLLSNMHDKYFTLEDFLKLYIKGQDRAIANLCRALMASVMRKKENKPIATFLEVGPTSTGKTEVAKLIARHVFDSDKNLLQYNCTDYMEEHAVSSLIGAPPGYVGSENGGKLVNDLKLHPCSVILFDEIEKAHPKVLDMLLPMLEEGVVTDRSGRVADVTNCIIILTSNIGAERDNKSTGVKGKVIGFGQPAKNDEEYEEQQNEAMDRVGDYLKSINSKMRPEFIARINEIIVFNSLTKEAMKDIARNKLNKILESYTQFHIAFDDSVLDFLVKRAGNNPRTLEQVIQRHIESHITKRFCNKQIVEGDKLILVIKNNEIGIQLSPNE